MKDFLLANICVGEQVRYNAENHHNGEKDVLVEKAAGGMLRRLVLELSLEQLKGGGQEIPPHLVNLLEKVESLETLHVLKMVPGEFAAIARVEVKDPRFRFEEIFPAEEVQGSKFETELLDRESDTISTYLMKSSMRPDPRRVEQTGSIPYIATPFEYRDRKLQVAYLGSSSQIRRLLAVLARLSKQSRIRYRVASLGDAKFPPNSPIGRLTDKQRRVLITAYRLGYYDVPRKITAEELSKRLNLVKSTFSAHVRKAERRLLTEMLSEI